ncbi:MAG: hypothetical protein MJ078_06460, partial [Clostridia bacterium]|nr:hypothetical protein [Clostridia bacterium]
YSLLTAVNAADGWEVSLERKTLPGSFYREVGFDVSGAADEQEAVRTVLRGLENLFPENRSQTVLKIRLSGAVTPDFRLSDGFAQSFSDFYAAVPEDATLPLLPPAGGYPFEAAKRLHQNALSVMAGGTEEEKRHNAAVFRAAYRALVYGEADMG